MDWTNNYMYDLGAPAFGAQAPNEDAVDDDEEDFYQQDQEVNGEATPGALTQAERVVPQPPQPTAEAVKAENQRRAETLRAKLLAQRQNTPAKAVSRPNTPSVKPAQTQTPNNNQLSNTKVMQPPQHASNPIDNQTNNKAINSDLLDALLNEGKAAADAKIAEMEKAASTAAATQLNGHVRRDSPQKKEVKQEATADPAPMQQTQLPTPATRPTNISDAYYVDLLPWLEVTGYHDVDYRNAKLQTYKERKALEEEAARIAERLESLRKAEQASMQSLRAPAPFAASTMAPPALPAALLSERAERKHINTNKRAHSPEPLPADKGKRREGTGGFRIRGANDSPDTLAGSARRPRSPSPSGLERRISYPDIRRRSNDVNARSRDPSPERRQNYYRRDTEANGYDSYLPPPRDGPRPFNSRPPPPHARYRGSAPLDLRKGGVRYFMIKSWNHENVTASQRENLWATQEKNEQMLTEAYHNCRHVVLLFSVNKSTAFQGYAIMTSAPDPKLPKPAFCAKLNWDTSPAFSIRWLATTPVHFKMIGHLKNTMNPDERGEPRAVLIGKDGQEISNDAGMGVVWVLDEEEVVGRG